MCETKQPHGRRCKKCGGPRVLRHDELDRLTIAHLDCDAFYAAIEKRDNPDLADKPVIIGGGRRGVVSTACYVARTFGVGSAMPMFKALKACPDAIVIRPNMQKYTQAGREIRDMMRELSPLVEPLSLDEAFIDLTGTERLHGITAAQSMAKLARRIEDTVGITVSVGLSYNKFLAKMASDMDKPRGFAVVGAAEAVAFLGKQPVSLIWGVGKAFERALARDGITHIKQLQQMDERTLASRYGAMGLRLYHLARGEDARRIHATSEAKSISSETTFNQDISDFETLSKILWSLSEKVATRAKAGGMGGNTVVLKLKDESFKIRTRNKKLMRPTQLADVIYRAADELLKRETRGEKFRLIGVGISSLVNGDFCDQPDLLDPDGARRAKAERAMDSLKDKFGADAIKLGRGLRKGT